VNHIHQVGSQEHNKERSASRRLWLRLSVVMLLISVAGLSTLAKDGQYYPKTHPARYVSISTKMNVSHAPILVSRDKLQLIARISPPLPTIRRIPADRSEAVPTLRIGVIVSMQHRSPPSSLA
jgi:hypothetical protein